MRSRNGNFTGAEGEIKPSPNSNFLKFQSVQYNFIDRPARLYYIKSFLYGITFEGLHTYIDTNAVMRIKLASFVNIVEVSGKIMNKRETLTMFNDICVLAPAALISNDIK